MFGWFFFFFSLLLSIVFVSLWLRVHFKFPFADCIWGRGLNEAKVDLDCNVVLVDVNLIYVSSD